MGIKSKTLIVRVDERTYMLLEEISRRNRVGISVVIRALVSKGLNEIIDESGNLKMKGDEKTDSVQPDQF